MKVRINGKEQTVGGEVKTVLDLIIKTGLVPEDVVVEYNHFVLTRDKWGGTKVKDGDVLEILSFVGGG